MGDSRRPKRPSGPMRSCDLCGDLFTWGIARVDEPSPASRLGNDASLIHTPNSTRKRRNHPTSPTGSARRTAEPSRYRRRTWHTVLVPRGESDMSAGWPGSGQTLIAPAPLAFATGAATQVRGMRLRGEERYRIPDELDGRPTALPRRTSRPAAAGRLVARRPGRPSRQSLRARLQHRTTSPAGE